MNIILHHHLLWQWTPKWWFRAQADLLGDCWPIELENPSFLNSAMPGISWTTLVVIGASRVILGNTWRTIWYWGLNWGEHARCEPSLAHVPPLWFVAISNGDYVGFCWSRQDYGWIVNIWSLVQQLAYKERFVKGENLIEIKCSQRKHS